MEWHGGRGEGLYTCLMINNHYAYVVSSKSIQNKWNKSQIYPPPLSILGCSVEKWRQQFPPGNQVFLVSDFLHRGTPNNYNCISCYPTNILYFPQCGFHKTSGGEKQRKEERRPLGKIYSPPGQLKSNLYDVSWNDVEWLNVSINEFTSAEKHSHLQQQLWNSWSKKQHHILCSCASMCSSISSWPPVLK